MNQKKLWNDLAKKNSKYYINSDWGKNITEKEFSHSGWKDFKKLILEDNLVERKGTLLDFGCGIGRILQFAGGFFDKLIGIDISGEMIKQAKTRLAWLIKLEEVELIETDGETIPLKDNSVDFTFSYLVFQHIKERSVVEKNFEEVYRVLKPGGLFKVRIRSDKVDLDRWWGGVEYTEQSIGLLIKKIGYKLLKTEPVEDYGFWLWLKK